MNLVYNRLMKIGKENCFIEVYILTDCPFCPPVKEYCEDLKNADYDVKIFDETHDEFKSRTEGLGIYGFPSVVIVKNKTAETPATEFMRTYSVDGLKFLGLET